PTVEMRSEHALDELAILVEEALPTTAHDGVVAGHVPAAAARGALVVPDVAVAPVDHAAAGHAGLQAEVDVLVPVRVRLVEAAELEEELAAHGQTGSRDDVEVVARARGRQVTRLVVEEMKGVQHALLVTPPRDAAMLDRAVGVEQPNADGADAGVERLLDERLERARGRPGVRGPAD